MKIDLPLPQEKKLVVICRVEAGCLGPNGDEHVEPFCDFAKKEYEHVDADYLQWQIEPRHDKSLPEMQFQVDGKNISREQAGKYLSLFQNSLDSLEERLHGQLGVLIDHYFGRA